MLGEAASYQVPFTEIWYYSMSRESVQRFREKDMHKQIPKAYRVNPYSRDML
jgi:hypothetical protein